MLLGQDQMLQGQARMLQGQARGGRAPVSLTASLARKPDREPRPKAWGKPEATL